MCIRHGLTLEESAHLRRPNAEYALKGGAELAALPPGMPDADPLTGTAWLEGIAPQRGAGRALPGLAGVRALSLPGLPGARAVRRPSPISRSSATRGPGGATTPSRRACSSRWPTSSRSSSAPASRSSSSSAGTSCASAASAASRRRAGAALAIRSWPMRWASPGSTPSATSCSSSASSTRAAPTYPDVDIDFASSRREEVIQYVYERYGAEHTGMVCNVVTYRARSAVREVGYALGFPRPLVDRVAKALETYDSVMVRRDLEADGGFAEFFAAPAEGGGQERPDGSSPAAGGSTRGRSPRALATEAVPGAAAATRRRAARPWAAGRGDRLPRRHGRAAPCPGRPAGGRPGHAGRGARHRPDGAARGHRTRRGGCPGTSRAERHDRGRAATRVSAADSARAHAPAALPRARHRPAAGAHRRRGRPRRHARQRRTSCATSGQQPGHARGREAHAGRAASRRRRGRPGRPRALAGLRLGRQRHGAGAGWRRRHRRHATAHTASLLVTSVGSVELDPLPPRRRGSTLGLSPWDRWLELCARIDGFPRHLSIHVGGMLVTGRSARGHRARSSAPRCPAGSSSSSTSATSRR